MGRRSSSRPPFHKRGGSPAGRVPFPRGQSIFSSSSSPTFEEGVEPNLGGASTGDTSRGGESGQETHYVDENWKLQNKILNFCHLPPPHNAQALHDKVLALLKGWGIHKKIFSITLDNARCNDNMQDLLADSLSVFGRLPSDGDYFHIRCGAHFCFTQLDARSAEYKNEQVKESLFKLFEEYATTGNVQDNVPGARCESNHLAAFSNFESSSFQGRTQLDDYL
ncbi:hypothetical protein SOVF_004260, partial [Spinacia oleracea]